MNYQEYFKGKRVAIPGGGGFFGTHLREKLQNAGCELFIPRTKDGVDFRIKEHCDEFYKVSKPDIVINCAANQGGIAYHRGRQAELFEDNMRMGMFLMKAAQEAGVKKFVNIVAGCAYPGNPDHDVMNENEFWNGLPHETIFSYGFPRRASVVFGKALKMQHGFNSIHLVLANMYGPGEHFHPDQSKALAGLLKKLYEAKRGNLPSVEVWGTGKPVRDWLYVKDGAEGVLRAAATYEAIEPLNIASGVGVSVRDLAETIKGIIGYTGELVFNADKPDGALKKTFGVAKMQATLDWLPETTLEDGIRETLAWFSNNYEKAIAY